MVLEARRAVITDSHGEEVAVEEVVVHTTEERNEVRLLQPASLALGVLATGAGVSIGAAAPVLHVAPFVADHEVEVIGLVEVLHILCVGRIGEVELLFCRIAVVAIVEVRLAPLLIGGVLRTVAVVTGKIHVETKVLKTMDLVVKFEAALPGARIGHVVLLVEEGHRVRSGIPVLGQWIGRVVQGCTVVGPGEVAAEVFETGSLDWLGRVETSGLTHGCSVGIVRIGIHELGIGCHGEVVVEELGVEVQAGCCTLEGRGLQDTFLVGIACREAVGNALQTARDGHVVVVTDGVLIDLILPVGRSIAHEGGSLRISTVIGGDEFAILVCIHHIHTVGSGAEAYTTVVADLRLTARTFLGGNDDDAVRTTATIDGGGRCVLQHGEGLDVGRVHHRKAVRQTFHTLVIHSHTVNHDERIVRCVE